MFEYTSLHYLVMVIFLILVDEKYFISSSVVILSSNTRTNLLEHPQKHAEIFYLIINKPSSFLDIRDKTRVARIHIPSF